MRGEEHPSHPRQDLRSNDRSPHPPKGREMRECAPSARSKRERVRGWRRPVEVADPPPAFPRRPTVALLWPGYVRVASGISCGGVGEQPGIRLLARAREGRGYCLCSGSAPPGTRAARYYGWMGVSWRPPGGFFSTSPMSFHRTVTPGTTIAPPSWGEPVSTFLFLKKKTQRRAPWDRESPTHEREWQRQNLPPGDLPLLLRWRWMGRSAMGGLFGIQQRPMSDLIPVPSEQAWGDTR